MARKQTPPLFEVPIEIRNGGDDYNIIELVTTDGRRHVASIPAQNAQGEVDIDTHKIAELFVETFNHHVSLTKLARAHCTRCRGLGYSNRDNDCGARCPQCNGTGEEPKCKEKK